MTITNIHRYLSGEANAAENKAFEEWLAASADNRAQFEEYRKIYTVKIERTERFDTIAALQTFRKNRTVQLPESSEPQAVRKTKTATFRALQDKRNSGIWLKLAAVLLIVFGISMYVLYPRFIENPAEVTGIDTGVWYETAYGEQRTYRLPDGSRIRLNADSRLFLPDVYGQETRSITLIGEGFFEIESDTTLPFVVQTAEATVEVIGTSFGVRTRPEQGVSYIAVQSGRVSVQGFPGISDESAKGVEVGAGEFTRVTYGAKPDAPSPNGAHALLSWTRQYFLFNDTPLSEVILQLERHFNVHITLSDSSRATQPVTARYASESLNEILSITSLTHGLSFEVSSRNSDSQ
ncbi:FecR family protein [Cyclonatronum proteinivorum]|uniref:FecR family protein n=1 Tax=Cyclonatronum proteinivorum TaxID=1457365 RepID=A0A345UN24_9BACT|nr:FecR domain-containing protein [Cyclonatronum proteinivorum]AXJ01876.1 FecR family protein [Cyclonatronum proteinivorum]